MPAGKKPTAFSVKSLSHHFLHQRSISGILVQWQMVKRSIPSLLTMPSHMPVNPERDSADPWRKISDSAIHMKSNVRLHLEDSAKVIFSVNPKIIFLRLLPDGKAWTATIILPDLRISSWKYCHNGNGRLNGQADHTNWCRGKGKKHMAGKQVCPAS